ncbi:MAG: hypothetical protein M0Z28_29045 [Rhodospirillales bacterium]|nr:hypothetical protein [Rhodospirillales bacterium]
MADRHDWRIRCVAWEPNADSDPRRLGFADLLLPGGLVLQRVNFLLTADGNIRSAAPHAAKRGPAAFRFATDADWRRFSAAAVAAVRRFDPAALPDAPAAAATPSAPNLAPANEGIRP